MSPRPSQIWPGCAEYNMVKKASSPRPSPPKEEGEQTPEGPVIRQTNRDPRLTAALIAGALFLVTMAVFWPAVHNEFVNYDDPDYVTSNPHVQGGFTGENLK